MSKSHPFLNAKEFISWANCNCACCSKSGTLAIPGSSRCEIFEAIAESVCMPKIEINSEIAKRFGEIRSGRIEVYPLCPEREART